MKISVILVAGAQGLRCRDRDAQTCEFGILMNSNLWVTALPETHNFVSDNWEQFAETVESVSRADHFLQG